MMTAKAALEIVVAKRQQLEKALRQNQEILKQVEHLANIGHFERDLVNDQITWSDQVPHIFGWQPGRKFSQADLEKFIHPEDRQLQRQALNAVLHDRRPYNVEYRIIRSDGQIRFIHIRDEVKHDKSGRPVRIFGTVQDVTEHKKAEELRKRYHRLTRREREVMNLVVRGMLNKQIAAQ